MSFSLHGVVSFGFCPFTFIDLPPAFDRVWFWTLRRCRKKAQLEPAHSCGYRFPIVSRPTYRTNVLLFWAVLESCVVCTMFRCCGLERGAENGQHHARQPPARFVYPWIVVPPYYFIFLFF
ncbi:unnamed protein product [Ectocarpus sp. 8 AP-2014]